MRRLFVLVMVALLLAAALVYLIEYDPGYVLISFGHYTVESTVWVALIAAAVLWVLLALALKLARRGIEHSRTLTRWLNEGSLGAGRRVTLAGVMAYTEGNWPRAMRTLARAGTRAEVPLINYLLAARAAHRLQQNDKAEMLLQQAERSTASASLAVTITRAELLVDNGQLAEAWALLHGIKGRAARAPAVLRLKQRVSLGQQDWLALRALLPQLRQRNIVSAEQAAQLAQRVARGLLDVAARENSAAALRSAWQSLDKASQHDGDNVLIYAQALAARGDAVQAEQLLRQQLQRQWQPALVDFYGLVDGADSGKQLRSAQRWLQDRPDDAALLLCLGRLALRQQLWGMARHYLESSLQRQGTPAACAELARLLAALGEHSRSGEYWQRAQQLAGLPMASVQLPSRLRASS